MTHKIPLHFNTRHDLTYKKLAQKRVEHWQAMMDMNQNGFRSAPSSDHNRDFHRKGPATKLEALYKLAEQ